MKSKEKIRHFRTMTKSLKLQSLSSRVPDPPGSHFASYMMLDHIRHQSPEDFRHECSTDCHPPSPSSIESQTVTVEELDYELGRGLCVCMWEHCGLDAIRLQRYLARCETAADTLTIRQPAV